MRLIFSVQLCRMGQNQRPENSQERQEQPPEKENWRGSHASTIGLVDFFYIIANFDMLAILLHSLQGSQKTISNKFVVGSKSTL